MRYMKKIASKCNGKNPLVAINCITYNHEKYIRETLDGFIKQKTKFPFVAIVHDDASTDGTRQIIQEYADKFPEIILPIFESENQYSKGGFSRISKIMNNAIEETGAKYTAICEGDDYWTDPLKLQNQVEFMESHPDYGMCYTRVKRLYQDTNIIKDSWGGPNEILSSLLLNNTIPTLTVLLRTSTLNQYYADIQTDSRSWKMADYPIWLYFAATSKIKFVDSESGVYRILKDSASHKLDIITNLEFRLNFSEIGVKFAKEYGTLDDIHRTNINVLWYKFLILCNNSNNSQARKLALNSFWKKQLSLKRNLLLIIGFLSPNIVKKIYIKNVGNR